MSHVTTYSPDEIVQVIGRNSGLFLVHFGSPLASACEFVKQELEALAGQFDGSPIHFAEVELPLQDFELIQSYNLEEIPTLILFADDGEVERLERILLPEELKEFLETAMSFYGPAAEGPADSR